MTIGTKGEQMAAEHLLSQGYELLARNWRWGKAEMDIVARIEQTVAFVEVKTRSSVRYGFPDESVGPKKERLMIEAAGQFLYLMDWQGEFRFDVIAIVLGPEPRLVHYPDAFFPFYCEPERDFGEDDSY